MLALEASPKFVDGHNDADADQRHPQRRIHYEVGNRDDGDPTKTWNPFLLLPPVNEEAHPDRPPDQGRDQCAGIKVMGFSYGGNLSNHAQSEQSFSPRLRNFFVARPRL